MVPEIAVSRSDQESSKYGVDRIYKLLVCNPCLKIDGKAKNPTHVQVVSSRLALQTCKNMGLFWKG